MNNCYGKKEKSSFKNEIMQDVNDHSKPMFTNENETNKIVQNRELGHIIEEALGRIPFDYRMAFSLREINGLNVSETANLLNISESNVKVRLNRAKTMLRTEIGGYIVAAWLTGIALTLLLGFNYVDVAVRDLVMAISAFSMSRISKIIAYN